MVCLILFVLWYLQKREIEPLIGIITSGGFLLVSIITKLSRRPKIVLHYNKIIWGRGPKGYTKNNPPIIRVGIDKPDIYWELQWNYELEIRNNSSITAYNLEIEYINLPPKTLIEGKIGKIEPIMPNDIKKFKIKLIQNITGTSVDADEYLNKNAITLTANFVIKIKYQDESGFTFKTKYHWALDKNEFPLF